MADDYTPFDNIGSGENGTVEGLLDLEGGASSFRYRKIIQVVVQGSNPDDFGQDIEGSWKVRLREDAQRGADGGYTGTVLFEQTVEWTAGIIAIGIGGIDFVTWSPSGNPAGAGKQQTSICNGEPCAVIVEPQIASAEEAAAYGATGAWRFVNESYANISANAQPNQKYDAERGFVAPKTFDPVGMAAIGGGYAFYCEWQSPDYITEIPEGAILETVYDRWQVGRLDDEATFRFSYVGAASSLLDALRDPRIGQSWFLSSGEGGLLTCATSKKVGGRVASASDARVLPQAPTGTRARFANLARVGATLLCPIGTGGAFGLRVQGSFDGGRSWSELMSQAELEGQNLQPLASAASPDGSLLWVYGSRDEGERKVAGFVVLKSNAQGRYKPTRQGTSRFEAQGASGWESVDAPLKDVMRLEAWGSTLRLTTREKSGGLSRFRVWVSTDEMKLWREVVS